MKKRLLLIMIGLGMCLVLPLFAQTGITFEFNKETDEITGTSPKYYEFDVMARASSAGTKLGDTMIYINYNTLGFGDNIYSNGKVTVTKGTLLQGDVMGSDKYTIVAVADNASNRIAITLGYNFDTSPTWANDLPASNTQLIHVKIEIADQGETSSLSFQGALMPGQQYESDNVTAYVPVTATDGMDVSLPVTMSSITGIASRETGITIAWETASERECSGYHVWKSEREEGPYERITDALIPGAGTSSAHHAYELIDREVKDILYWYKIEEIRLDGRSTFYDPISIMGVNTIPTEFALSQNYPNPFNPETTIDYQLPEDGRVVIKVYTLLGETVTDLVDEEMQAGYYHAIWDGMDNNHRRVASGIYFIHMVSKDFRQVRKITLLK